MSKFGRRGVESRVTMPALISYGEYVYRSAGYGIPQPGELYVSKTGHIKIQRVNCQPPQSDVLLVRIYSPEDFK
jgi:hypothetical protein